jgi:TolA-binding protein
LAENNWLWGALLALCLGFGTWASARIVDLQERQATFDRTQAEIFATLRALQYANQEAHKDIKDRLDRIEGRMERLAR